METDKEDLETLEEQTRIQLLTRGNYTCNTKLVSKEPNKPQYQNTLHMNNEIIENAQKISAILKTIPQHELYFQTIIETENIELGKLYRQKFESAPQRGALFKSVTDNLVEECTKEDISKKISQPVSKFVSLKVRYYDKLWKQEMLEIKEKNPTKTLQVFIDSVQYMIQILKYLQMKNIVHFNIHEKNLVCSSVRKTPVLTNYNLSFEIEDLKKEEIENIFPNYEDYSVWPIEVYFASRISNIKEQQPESWASIIIENEQIEEWVEHFTQSAIFMKIASEERRELLKIQLTQYFQPIIGKTLKLLYENVIESGRTWDIYSVGIVVLDTFILLELHENIQEYNFIREFIDVIKTVVYANPNARPSIEYIEQAIIQIFSKVPTKTYSQYTNQSINYFVGK
jgi:hypothetical protein